MPITIEWLCHVAFKPAIWFLLIPIGPLEINVVGLEAALEPSQPLGTFLEKNHLFDLRTDLPHSWVRPVDWCLQK